MTLARLLPPVLFRELVQLAKRRATYVTRTLYAVLLYAIAMISVVQVVSAATRSQGMTMGTAGVGSTILIAVHVTVCIGLYVMMPAMVVGSVASERENGTLELMLLTQTSPLQIILQKLFARSVPVLAMLSLAAPFMAIAYGLGGVSVGDLWAVVICWLSLTLKVGMVSLMCSAMCRNVVRAFFRSYVVLLLIGVGGGVVSTIPVMFLAFAFANVGGGVGAGLWIYTSMELLVFAVAFFPLLILAKRAIASTEVKQHVPLKRAFDEDRVVVQVTASGKVERRIRRRVLSLPGSRPVAWRECTNALVGTKKRTLRLTALVSGGVGAFLAHIVLVVIADGGGEVGGFAFVTACLWIAAVFVISLHVANLISKERANGTLVTLMATPLTARDILAQKLAAAWRLCLVLGAPMLLTALVAAVVVPIGDEPYRVNIGYLLVSCLTSVVYLYGLVWIPFSACLRQRRRAHVVVTALSRVMLVLFAPLLVSLLTVGMNEHGVAEFFSMMSPMVFAAMVQFGDSPVYERLWIIPVNLGFYLGLALLLRAYVYARGPALLKRVGR